MSDLESIKKDLIGKSFKYLGGLSYDSGKLGFGDTLTILNVSDEELGTIIVAECCNDVTTDTLKLSVDLLKDDTRFKEVVNASNKWTVGISKISVGDTSSILYPPKPPKSQQYNPLEVQEGGGHYKGKGIQPLEYANANNLNPQKFNIVKYITRHEEKNQIEDLSKVIHYALLEAYFQYGVEGSTELKQRVLKMLGVGDDR